MKRTWTGVGDELMQRVRLEDEDGNVERSRVLMTREKVEKAIDGLKWQEPEGDVPMMPGLGVMEAITQLRIPKVDSISISCMELAPYGFYGIQGNYRNGRARVYIVDTGTGLTVVCSDFWAKES